MTDDKTSGIHLARPGQLVWPAEQAEARLVISVVDFVDLREQVEAMKHPVAEWANWVATFFGAALGTFVSWLVIPDKGTTQGIVIVCIAASCSALALFMLVVGLRLRKLTRSDKDRVVKRFTRLHETCPQIRPSSDEIH